MSRDVKDLLTTVAILAVLVVLVLTDHLAGTAVWTFLIGAVAPNPLVATANVVEGPSRWR